MAATSFIDLNINNAEQFKESVSEPTPNTKLYLTFGKTDPWANEASPNVANTSSATIYEVWKNMIGGKKIVGSDIAHVIPRIDWTMDTRYDAYHHLRDDLYDTGSKPYVVTNEWNVYKCIANNYSSNSIVKPTSVNPSIISTTSDGYHWKYMYTVSDAEQLRFTTTSYMPVKTLSINDGSLQWSVQESAVDGAIHYIEVLNGGDGYTNANVITVTVTGDGTDATAFASTNTISNTINSIIMITNGSQYTTANVSISSSIGANATARAIISPHGGHGANPLYELGGKNLMVNGRLKYDEGGKFTITNDFRQISLIKDPLLKGTSNTVVNTAFLQASVIVTVGSGDYDEDEWVYQGASLNNSTFQGKVLAWYNTTGKLYLINTKGIPTASQGVIGTQSAISRIISSVTEEEAERYSGRILYVDNIKPITRAEDQIEDFKLLIKF